MGRKKKEEEEKGRIKVLDEKVSDLIAAGVVIDRPASVVRELVENAIDAGATQITVEIRHGGCTYIRVTDDGCGILPEDVPLAFTRHATSKIGSVQDLEQVSTLGFRGEALAAISSVAHVMMVTKVREQPVGWSYVRSYGKEVEQGEAGGPDGTTIIVRGLFAETLTQMKFLQKDTVEGAAVQETVQREALAHPEVAFRLMKDNGKPVIATPGDGDLRNTVYAVLGNEVGQSLVGMMGGDSRVSVRGYISKPTMCQPSRAKQFFFVNGRWVRSKLASAALEEAYQNAKMVGRFPAGVVCITLPAVNVDVNCDPAKAEVRFANDKRVHDAIYLAAMDALGMPIQRTPAPVPPDLPDPFTDMYFPLPFQDQRDFAAENLARHPDKWWLPMEEQVDLSKFPTEEEFEKREAERKKEGAPLGAAFAPAVSAPDPAFPEPDGNGIPVGEEPARLSFTVGEEDPWAAPDLGDVPSLESAPWDVPPAEPTAAENQETLLPQEPEQPWRVVGEVMHTYIIVEQGDKVFFIDKHAAHERMGFDVLRGQGHRPMAQELIEPLVVKPGPQEAAILQEHAKDLEEFGFSVEPFGEDALVVRQVPDYLTRSTAPEMLTALAESYATTGAADPDAQRDELLHSMACKAAMKGGQKSQPEELQRVAEAVMSGQVTQCPHGRPVSIQITQYQLERDFHRK